MANCSDNCNNNCEALDGLYEKSVNLIAYSNLISSWINGPANGTVNIAGVNRPTLLNLVTTLQNNSSTLITTLQNRINNLPSSIIQDGGGISIDSNGQLFINFDDMPTDKFEYLLKSLRLPIWLTANKSFYVDKSHASASDTLSDKRGETASKPFKTIQACVDYVTDNYNMSRYALHIKIAPGTYEERLTIPQFNTNTGYLQFEPYTIDSSLPVIIKSPVNSTRVIGSSANAGVRFVHLHLLHMLDLANISGRFYPYTVAHTGSGSISFTGCKFELGATNNSASVPVGSSVNGSLIYASAGSSISILHDSLLPTYLYGFERSIDRFSFTALLSQGNASIAFDTSDTNDSMNNVYYKGYFATVAWANGGSMTNSTGSKTYAFNMTTESGKSVYGRRYNCTSGGKIYTAGAGPNYFPGDVAGTVDSSTYSWYK